MDCNVDLVLPHDEIEIPRFIPRVTHHCGGQVATRRLFHISNSTTAC